MKPNIKITPRQIRSVFDSGKVWAIQPLHVSTGVPANLCGYYSVPLADQRKHYWGRLSGSRELKILREWVNSGFKQPD